MADKERKQSAAGIRGLLLLPAMHLMIAPLVAAITVLVYFTVMSPVYKSLAPEGVNLRWLNLFEILGPILSAVLAVLAGVAFFSKRRSTAAAYGTFLLADVVVAVTRYVWVWSLIGVAATGAERQQSVRTWLLVPLIISVAMAAVGGLSFMLSPRHRATFTDDASRDRTERLLAFTWNFNIQVFAAVAILVLGNIMVYRWVREYNDPRFRDVTRFDFTQTRLYSLSDQTRKVLGNLDGDYRIVGLIHSYTDPQRQTYAQSTQDLLAEYDRRSPRIVTEVINPGMETVRYEAFLKELEDRYSERLEPVRTAIREAITALESLTSQSEALAPRFEDMLKNPDIRAREVRSNLATIYNTLRSFGTGDTRTQQILQDVLASLDAPMPDLAAARQAAEFELTRFNDGVLEGIRVATEGYGRDERLPAEVRESLLAANREVTSMATLLEQPLATLRSVPTDEEYDQLRQTLMIDQMLGQVVVIGPDSIEAMVMLGDMYRQAPTEALENDGEPSGPGQQVQFLAEERLTGALLQMSMQSPPLVVFLPTGSLPVFGNPRDPSGSYQTVRESLEASKIEVREWSPLGRMDPMTNRSVPPGDPPTPKPGQKVVWVLVPPGIGELQSMNPMMLGAAGQVVDFLRDRLEAGDAAMVLSGPSPGVRMGLDPVVDLLLTWNINAMVDRTLMQRMQVSETQSVPQPGLVTSRFPTDTLIGKALSGLNTAFPLAGPLRVTKANDERFTALPLVRAYGSGYWAEKDDLSDMRNIKPDDDEVGEDWLVGVAVERNGQRLIVTTDGYWASDELAGSQTMAIGGQQVQITRFPGNRELFVNSIYWLADLEELIAASARSREIRRVGDIAPGTQRALSWSLLLGLPTVAMLAGLGVWFVRRRG